MRVLALSDQVVPALYGPAIREIAEGVKLVLSAGDLPSDYLEYFVSMLDVPLFYVMGNHGAMGGEKAAPDGCENIDRRVVSYGGLLIAGFEGSIRYNAQPDYQYTDAEMRARIASLLPALALNKIRYGRYVDIVLTHAPPYGIHDGTDPAHRGFESYLWLIDHLRPRYLIHGHQHVYDKRTVTRTLRGRTLVINAYGYKIIDVAEEYARPKTRAVTR